MSDPMTKVREARDAYEQAKEDSKALLANARIQLGRAISEARDQQKPQEEIAKDLGLTTERLRLFQREYEKTLTQGAGSSAAELELAERILAHLIGKDPEDVARFVLVYFDQNAITRLGPNDRTVTKFLRELKALYHQPADS